MADVPSYPGAPRWVKIVGIIVIGLILVVATVNLMGIGGHHGPGRHMRSENDNGDTVPSGVTEEHTPSGGPGGHAPPGGGH